MGLDRSWDDSAGLETRTQELIEPEAPRQGMSKQNMMYTRIEGLCTHGYNTGRYELYLPT
jgi:hypothetical protein